MSEIDSLRAKVAALEAENARLREGPFVPSTNSVVKAPPPVQPLFDKSAETIGSLFRQIDIDPSRGTLELGGERYVLLRGSALSIDFLDTLVQLYAERGEREALAIARSFLFDIAHTIGIHDARTIHEKLGSRDPLEKLAGGPVHFAYTGWAYVDIKESSNPVPDDTYSLVYDHPWSFEAGSFLRAGRTSEGPACIMNAGYSSGWCEASFGLELTAVEVTCRAAGHDTCSFVMAPPNKINQRVREHFGIDLEARKGSGFFIPTYFERKRAEEEVRNTLERLQSAQAELLRRERLATVGLLVSGVAHEVNTPLGVAVTAAGIIDEEIKKLHERFAQGKLSKRDFEAFFDRAGQASRLAGTNLGRAAEQIAKFKRVSVDHATQDRRRLNLEAHVRETMESLAPVARKAQLEVTVTSAGSLDCVTHPGAISQLLTNFLTNTALHAGAKNVHVEIAREDDGRVRLRYSDDGRGMADDVKAKAFEPFFTTHRHEGTGLGLHIVSSVVNDVLKGKLALETAPGKGVRFDVVFPISDA